MPCLASSLSPCSLMCDILRCHNLACIWALLLATTASPLKVVACRMQIPFYSTALMHIKDPLVIFKTPPSPLKLRPFRSNSPREIKFLLSFGTCLTAVRVLYDLSYIFSLMLPIPNTFHSWSFPSKTFPYFIS